MPRSTRRFCRAPRSAAWSSSRGTAPSAGCAPLFTMRCRSRGCRRWSPTSRTSSGGTDRSLRMSHYRILTLNQISAHGLHRFPSSRYTVGKAVDNPDAIIVRSHDMHAMAVPPSVKAIGRAGAGTNNIPVKEMSARGVPVFNAPGANANAVKELVLTALLLAARNVVPALRYVDSLDSGAADLEARVEE